jgi:hypothetical protein
MCEIIGGNRRQCIDSKIETVYFLSRLFEKALAENERVEAVQHHRVTQRNTLDLHTGFCQNFQTMPLSIQKPMACI